MLLAAHQSGSLNELTAGDLSTCQQGRGSQSNPGDTKTHSMALAPQTLQVPRFSHPSNSIQKHAPEWLQGSCLLGQAGVPGLCKFGCIASNWQLHEAQADIVARLITMLLVFGAGQALVQMLGPFAQSSDLALPGWLVEQSGRQTAFQVWQVWLGALRRSVHVLRFLSHRVERRRDQNGTSA